MAGTQHSSEPAHDEHARRPPTRCTSVDVPRHRQFHSKGAWWIAGCTTPRGLGRPCPLACVREACHVPRVARAARGARRRPPRHDVTHDPRRASGCALVRGGEAALLVDAAWRLQVHYLRLLLQGGEERQPLQIVPSQHEPFWHSPLSAPTDAKFEHCVAVASAARVNFAAVSLHCRRRGPRTAAR